MQLKGVGTTGTFAMRPKPGVHSLITVDIEPNIARMKHERTATLLPSLVFVNTIKPFRHLELRKAVDKGLADRKVWSAWMFEKYTEFSYLCLTLQVFAATWVPYLTS